MEWKGSVREGFREWVTGGERRDRDEGVGGGR